MIFDYLFSGVYSRLDTLLGKLNTMAAQLDDIIAGVADLGTVEDSMITLLNNIHAQLVAAGQDPAKLQALADTIASQKAKIVAATVANT